MFEPGDLVRINPPSQSVASFSMPEMIGVTGLVITPDPRASSVVRYVLIHGSVWTVHKCCLELVSEAKDV